MILSKILSAKITKSHESRRLFFHFLPIESNFPAKLGQYGNFSYLCSSFSKRRNFMEERIMSWERLLSSKRFGLERYHDAHQHTRTDFQRDYDRLVFSSPFRRLQNKTQVFPLPGSIFVHNRLTHSLEVSCVSHRHLLFRRQRPATQRAARVQRRPVERPHPFRGERQRLPPAHPPVQRAPRRRVCHDLLDAGLHREIPL